PTDFPACLQQTASHADEPNDHIIYRHLCLGAEIPDNEDVRAVKYQGGDLRSKTEPCFSLQGVKMPPKHLIEPPVKYSKAVQNLFHPPDAQRINRQKNDKTAKRICPHFPPPSKSPCQRIYPSPRPQRLKDKKFALILSADEHS